MRERLHARYDLRKAVAKWVRAEYEFRLGPQAYSNVTTDWYVDAENQLRIALTGKSDLKAAYMEMKRWLK